MHNEINESIGSKKSKPAIPEKGENTY